MDSGEGFMKYLCLILSLFSLQSCASQSLIIKNSTSIKAEMSADELRDVMGEPQNRQFKGNNEA